MRPIQKEENKRCKVYRCHSKVNTNIRPLPEWCTGVLPKDFHYGFATAATQIEGAVDADGKGPTIWDTFVEKPGVIKNGDKIDVCDRSYELYKEDIALLKKYGANSYRFSLCWSRLIPKGGRNDPINEAGIKHYSDMIDALIEAGITPFVTLFHWDTPQGIEDRYMGFLSREIIDDFAHYAKLAFERFGDRVKHWITFNEPEVFSACGYTAGIFAPGRKLEKPDEPLIVSHNLLLAHAQAAKIYRDQFQKEQGGQIGITLSGNWAEPWDPEDPADVKAAQNVVLFDVARYGDPVYFGDYPAEVKEYFGELLPAFTDEEKALLKGSSEFYGMNMYTSFYIRDTKEPAQPGDHKGGHYAFEDTNKAGKSRGKPSNSDWLAMAPYGFRSLLKWVHKRYNKSIYVTEQGCTVPQSPQPEDATEAGLDDAYRVEFYTLYLEEMARAIKEDGVDVRSYLAWSLLDNFEWAHGFSQRFGVTYVDFNDPERPRYPKRSASALRALFEQLIAK